MTDTRPSNEREILARLRDYDPDVSEFTVIRDAIAAFVQLRSALAGEVGLVQLLTARPDLQYDRDAIFSNHRHVEALSILEQSGSAEPKGDAAAAAGAESTAALSRTAVDTPSVKHISPTPLELLAERNERLERERAELRDCLEKTHEALCIAAKKAGFLPPPALPPEV